MADNNNNNNDKTGGADEQAAKAATDKQKQEEELQKAKDELKHIINTSKPKNLGQGLTSGVGNMLSGCVGGVGVVVLAPTLGTAMGAKHGGILGGALGLTAGAVVGVVGGAAMIVGGAISGVTQMVRGVAAQPEAMMAPGKGKWWNSSIGKWVYTDLPKDGAEVLELPEDDKDILGDLENEIDASANKGPTGNVVDPYYYEVLDVGTEAEPSAIKRKYYILARKYHPDKVGPDDKEAADKFKEVAEAYQVLSDPELRAKYDRDGRAGLSADKTEVADDGQPKIDPTILFAFLFGSDKFNNYIGRLSTATSASIGDSPKVSVTDAREIQRRRCIRIAVYMSEKLQPWVDTEDDYDAVKAMWTSEAEELSKASFGHQLVTLIGQVYEVSGEIFLGAIDSGIGIPSMSKWGKMQQAKMKKRKASQKNQMETLKVGMEVMGKQNKYAQELQNAKTDEEKQKVQEKMEEELSGSLLRILWTTTVVDITSTLHEVVQLLLHDQSVDVTTRTKRAYALKEFGRIWNECPAPTNKDGSEEVDAKKLYEEAAFAAMLETIQRKDEAAQHGGH